MVIRSRNLDHSGGFYMYRLHEDKIAKTCAHGLGGLKTYLHAVYDGRPDEYFSVGPRSSALKFKTYHDMIQVSGHEVSLLAQHGLEENYTRFRDNHSRVQVFMLENDTTTVAMEVPIWLQADELQGYNELFGSDLPLTGHIDVLRVDDDVVWIWDYKPNAHREKYASTQVYFYALMLSKRSGIPLEKFRCGYFDKYYSYLFNPVKSSVARNNTLVAFTSPMA